MNSTVFKLLANNLITVLQKPTCNPLATHVGSCYVNCTCCHALCSPLWAGTMAVYHRKEASQEAATEAKTFELSMSKSLSLTPGSCVMLIAIILRILFCQSSCLCFSLSTSGYICMCLLANLLPWIMWIMSPVTMHYLHDNNSCCYGNVYNNKHP